MAKSKYVNIPLSCLPETLTMARPEKDICNEALYKIGVDKVIEGKSNIDCWLRRIEELRQDVDEEFFVPLKTIANTIPLTATQKEQQRLELATLTDADYLGFGTCFGICQPQRPSRKHVDSTIVEPKQLT